MSTLESSPLLNRAYQKHYDPSSPILHEAESTMVNSASGFSTASSKTQAFGIQRESAPRNWVPDPESRDEEGRARTLIMCFDGTGDQFDDDNSNVVQFLSCLKKDNQAQQLIYYQAGIGTYTNSAFVTPVTNKASKILDEMVAWNLSTHVQEGYQYLMQNYRAGDKVCIFGFSRGAYTARALAGMVQKVGLLPPYNHAQIPFAWAMYTREDKDGLINSIGFKKTFSTDVDIDFLGVWDTVASVGIVGKELPFVGTNSSIRVFRHALSLDEHRVKFMPNFYHHSPDSDPKSAETAGSEAITAVPKTFSSPDQGAVKVNKPKAKKMGKHRSESEMFEATVNAQSGVDTDVLEVFFAGCHCDIGGGSVKNGTRNSLARIPLRWMIRECFRAETGIIFDKDMLKRNIGIDADMLYPIVRQRPARIPAPSNAVIAPRDPQPSAFLEFFKVIGGLIAIPLTIIARIIAFPIKHFMLLLKFTRAGKWVRNTIKSGWSAITGLFKKAAEEIKPDAPASQDNSKQFVSEEEEELGDALQPDYDQLSLAWFWWILELIPFRFREQKGKRDDYFVRANFGQGRKVYGDAKKNGIKVHRSVKTRLEVVDKRGKSVYKPRAWWKHHPAPDKKGKKVAGPEVWNIDNPDRWEWVD
ncbi:uncharacterized protein FOMMEDRAFT_167433 [Fomitiporia mediterranea MF3/22]|uniref:uncharacterized protein n=1 Tax=Fomitiporia mediterranea (strain MF3/22) TaxID=694068 RepID=UPI0004407324|nr:uncharacterized protein FOMMEDRAFT_167433 [Fomitiporia mediterranea MF3/22]EJD04194.1 hypothetical protein FOMMEDRAFT_167433 [Fomitiporia mediterranea MF3/22]